MRIISSILAFNRGLVSRLGLARIDTKKLALSAETFANWMPRILGSMMLRPGLGYIGATYTNSAAKFFPFIFSTTDTAMVELTNLLMRVWINDALVTRVSVSTVVANGNPFVAGLTSWTVTAGITYSAPYMQFIGNGTVLQTADQTVTVAAGDQNKEHALRIVIARGPVTLRVGTVAGDDSYIRETTLNTGTHSLSLTPTGNFVIRFQSSQIPKVWITSCSIEAAGVMTLPTSWLTADLNNVRMDQSGDILFVACNGYQQRMISRRSTTSWSVELYAVTKGPFMIENTTPTTLSPNALTGNVTVTASAPLFRNTNVGSLFEIVSQGQNVTVTIANPVGIDTWSDPIRITNVGEARRFTIVTTGTWTGTLTLQRSLDEKATWQDVTTYAVNQNTTYADGLDNQIIYYQLGVKAAGLTGGVSVTCKLSYSLGSITGIVRITDYTSTTSVGAEVLRSLGATTASDIWAESVWSDRRGWPSSVAFHEGRLWWAGKNGLQGSVSDDYTNYSPDVVGSSGTLNRTIGSGPVDTINWILSGQRLLIGTPGAEIVAKSSTFDEPITPTAFSIKTVSTQGCAAVQAVKIDTRAVFVQRNGMKLYEMAFNQSPYTSNLDYSSSDLCQFMPYIGSPGIIRMAIQRQPDTRIHCVRSDGTAAILIFDRSEEVTCWVNFTTDGLVEDVIVMPGANGEVEDKVYYVVNRTIVGATKRYLEKWASESECIGASLNKNADAFIQYNGSNLAHLEGKQVVVWANGVDIGTIDTTTPWTQTYTVSGGALSPAYSGSLTNVIVGLPYTAQFKSSKIGEVTGEMGSHLNQQKKISHIGLILADYHAKGIKFGPAFDYLDDLPGIERGITQSGITTTYDEQEFEFPGQWDTDLRLCLQAQAPRPVTVLAATIDYEENR